jgi:NitT/TauT family transport system ATP-binding protein
MLSIKNIDFHYNNNIEKIIDNFSYDFKKGKIYGIFWKSWLWKSTLARVISWFIKPTEGSIKINGSLITKPSKEIIYMNQRDDIFYRLTVYENLYLLCHDSKKVENILQKINLLEHKNYYPKHLSWWMVKRLSFARILLVQPKVLILDEPFVYIDWNTKKNLINLLIEIHKINKEMIILLISHNINEIKISNTVIVFKESINNDYLENRNN